MPVGAGTCRERGYFFAEREPPLDGGKVDTGRGAECNPGPGARIDVEDFVAAVARVILEFEFDQAGEPYRGQKSIGRLFYGRLLDRFHESAGDAEFDGVLAGAAGLDFPWMQWWLAHGQSVVPSRARTGVAWTHTSRDVVSAAQQIASGALSARQYWASPRSAAFAAFAADDPLPGVLDLPVLAARILRRRFGG